MTQPWSAGACRWGAARGDGQLGAQRGVAGGGRVGGSGGTWRQIVAAQRRVGARVHDTQREEAIRGDI